MPPAAQPAGRRPRRARLVGPLLALLLTLGLAGVALAADPPRFVRAWGSLGTGSGQFSSPRGVAVGPDGTVYVADTFNHRIQAFADPPMIGPIRNQQVAEDFALGPLPVTVGHPFVAASSLALAAAPSNQALLPDAAIVLGGSDANRTVTLTPAADQVGTATVTLTVSDGQLQAATSFVVTVGGINDPPTIDPIADQAIAENTTTGPLTVTVGDPETPTGGLVVTASSSDPTLVPPAGLALGGGGAVRTLTVTPALDRVGRATITVTVSDGALSARRSFTLTVGSGLGPDQVRLTAETSVTPDRPVVVAGLGAPARATIRVPSGVPEATLDLARLASATGGARTATLRTAIVALLDTSLGPIRLDLLDGLEVRGPSAWSARLTLPAARDAGTVRPANPADHLTGVVEIGAGDTPLALSRAVRLLLPGKAGQRVQWQQGGAVTAITTACAADGQADADALPTGGDCRLDVGRDLVVWTKHLTRFATSTDGCAPRPVVRSTLVPGAPGRLAVTVAATPLDGPANNPLRELRVTSLDNARLLVDGQGVPVGTTYTPPQNMFQLQLTVERVTPGQAATAHFTVVDGCGAWPTFVGGGPAAF